MFHALWYFHIVQDIVVGEICADQRNQLEISYPVSNGIVQNWDDMGHVWDHTFFNELKVVANFQEQLHNYLTHY